MKSDPSLFEVTVLLEGARYQYGFVAKDERFLEEWLYAWPRGRKQSWFERDSDTFKFGEHLLGENRLVEQVTRSNALFLSAAVQHRHAQLDPLYQWISSMQTVRVRRYLEPHWHSMNDEFEKDAWLQSVFLGPVTAEKSGRRRAFVGLLRAADVGIVDVRVEDLHPLLALKILRLFTDPTTNPNNAQVLFTTHDTKLLGSMTGEPALRRDQIWLTEKDDEGATTLYPLTDYKPRKGENLERGYLQGRYGAIPFLGELTLVPE